MPRKPRAQSSQQVTSTESMQTMFETIISLLGRLVFPPQELRATVMKWKKKDPEDYVKAYNLCDGEHTLSQIAEAIDVTAGTLSPILTEWKDLGIIYEVAKKGGRFYKKLYRLEMPRASEVAREEEPEKKTEEIALEKTQAPEREGKPEESI